MPLVSVIIPTYNSARFLPDAIDSVLKQTYRSYEIIVVNDGSTDNTSEVLCRYSGKITVSEQRNRGVAAARNTGIRAAQGEYIAFLDADDLWLPDKLALQLPLFERNPDVGLVYGYFAYVDEEGQFLREKEGRWYRGRVPGKAVFNISIRTGTVVVRKDCFETVGLFDENLKVCEDVNMWVRLAALYELDYVPRLVAKFRSRTDSLTEDKILVRKECINHVQRSYEHFKERLRISRRVYQLAIEKVLCRMGREAVMGGETRVGREFLLKAVSANLYDIRSLRQKMKEIEWLLRSYTR